MEHLAEHHPEVWPTDLTARAWARSATSEMHAGFSALRNECPMSVGVTIKLHNTSPDLQRDVERISELWAEGLNTFGGPYLAGEKFTAVDAFYAPVVFRINTYQLSEDNNVLSYCQRMLDTDGMRQWQQEGEQETIREPAHEDEIAALGTILEDRRA